MANGVERLKQRQFKSQSPRGLVKVRRCGAEVLCILDLRVKIKFVSAPT